MKQYNIGIIGTGTIAHTHAAAIASLPNAHLLGCFSRSHENCRTFAKQYGCLPFLNVDELIQHPKTDIVIVCTPSGSHLEAGLACMKAGKHVIIEKPLEITVERCDTLIACAEKEKVHLSCIFQSRFSEAAQTLKKAIDQGRFGTITLGDAIVKWYRTQAYYDSGAWRGTWELDGGGALMNQSIHAIDLLQWLMGPLEQIQAMTATLGHERIEVEDTACAIVKYQNGALGSIQGSTAVYPGFNKRIEISGTEGSVVLEDDYFSCWTFKNETEEDETIRTMYGQSNLTSGAASDPSNNPTELFALQIGNFIEAINTKTAPAISGVEARKSVEIIRGIYESASTNQVYRFRKK